MKISATLTLAIALSLASIQVQAQTEAPKGFKKGKLILADSTVTAGFVKANLGNAASVQFLAEAGGKKKTYSGAELISAEIDGTSYLCINGDFFKVVCNGELAFLQKESDASGQVTYNGTNAIISNGTEGKTGDYFIYTSHKKELKLVSKKNIDEVAAASFAGYPAAIDKAKAANGDVSQLKDAVIIYNSRGK